MCYDGYHHQHTTKHIASIAQVWYMHVDSCELLNDLCNDLLSGAKAHYTLITYLYLIHFWYLPPSPVHG